MTNERRLILDKVNMLIDKRKVELFKRFPSIHEIDDGIIINDRIWGNDLLICNYRVFSDRCILEKKLDIKWQHINTIGYSWRYNHMNAHSDYKTGEQIHKLK